MKIENIFRRSSKLSNRYAPYVFIAPYCLIAISFSVLPIIFTLILSFTKWDGMSPFQFVGLDNYYRLLFSDNRFFLTIFNTLLIIVVSIPTSIVLALIVSSMLNSKLMAFKRGFQLANFLPYITAPVAIGIIWSILFDWKYGTINQVLMVLDVIDKPINWLGEPANARLVVSIISIWKNYGYLIILFMAGITAISTEIYEAATVDGANSVQQFFRITLPLLKPVMTFVVVTGIIGGLQMFDEPYLLFKGGLTGPQPFGGPRLACLTMLMNFYDTVFRTYDLGFGASIAYGTFIVIAIFSFGSLKLMIRGDGD